jgi:hypothetical protein
MQVKKEYSLKSVLSKNRSYSLYLHVKYNAHCTSTIYLAVIVYM